MRNLELWVMEAKVRFSDGTVSGWQIWRYSEDKEDFEGFEPDAAILMWRIVRYIPE